MGQSDEEYLNDIRKRNRQIREEAEENRMVVGPRPDVIIRKESRKQRDRRRNLAIKDAIK